MFNETLSEKKPLLGIGIKRQKYTSAPALLQTPQPDVDIKLKRHMTLADAIGIITGTVSIFFFKNTMFAVLNYSGMKPTEPV